MKMIRNMLAAIFVILMAGWIFAPSQTVTTRVQMDASPEKVWAVLSDFENYENWNPFLTAASGNLSVGETLTIHFASKAFGDMDMSPIVLNVDPSEEF